MNNYGNKYENINKLYQNKKLRQHVPKAYPFKLDALDVEFIDERILRKDNNLSEELAHLLKEKYINCYETIEKNIGGFPWIIRSSGDEDSIINPNAGAYESYCCFKKEDFYLSLAKTLLSGMNKRAINQGSLLGIENISKAIPVFIQKLVTGKKDGKQDCVPLLGKNSINKIMELLKEIHYETNMKQLDVEWVIESEQGIISGTSISKINECGDISTELSLGFGLFSTQHCYADQLTRMIVEPNGVIKFQKNIYREVKDTKLWIIQARPAVDFTNVREVPIILEKDIQLLLNAKGGMQCKYDEVLILGKIFEISNVIVADTLVQAWSIYLQLTKKQQKKIGFVIVKIGSKLEHAGLMFNLFGITVLKSKQIDKLKSYKSAKCCVDFEKQRIFLLKNNVFKNKYCYSKNMTYIKEKLYLLYLDDYDYQIENLEKVTEKEVYIYPEEECIVISDDKIYAPCYLRKILEEYLNIGHAKEKIIKELPRKEISILAYIDAVYVKERETNYQFSHYLWFNKEVVKKNSGLIWLLMKLEEEIKERNLLYKLYDYFEAKECSNETKFYLVKKILLINRNIFALDCFEPNEVSEIYLNIAKLFQLETLHKNTLHDVISIASECKISPAYLQYFIEDKQVNNQLVNAYKHLERAIQKFSVNYDADLQNDCQEMILGFSEVKRNCYHNVLVNSCYHLLVEVFDDSAKKIAESLFSAYSDELYERYLQILEGFLNFIKKWTSNNNAVESVRNWFIDERLNSKKGCNYELKEYEIQKVLKDIKNGMRGISFENIHQVHNFLHQWALLEAPTIDNEELCKRVRDILEFCNTFCMEQCKVLRVQANLIEIELPMCTHKASFQLSETGFRLEFSEPPETEDENIARLVALDNIIERFFDKSYKVETFYEKQLGSWTWIVYMEVKEKKYYFRKFEYFVLVLRFLLDSSYDFSHTPVSDLGDVIRHFSDVEWGEIFEKLLDYRKNIYDIIQFTELKAFSLSDFFTQISTHSEYRDYVLKNYRNGFGDCFYDFDTKAIQLQQIKDPNEWQRVYKLFRLNILLLVSVWPKDLLSMWKQLKCYDEQKVLLAKNLLIRKDLQNLLAKNKVDLDNNMILHSVPHLLINTGNLQYYCKYLLKNKGCFKLAKQYVLYKYVQHLRLEDLKKLISELNWIPYPQDLKLIRYYEETGLEYQVYDIQRTLTILV